MPWKMFIKHSKPVFLKFVGKFTPPWQKALTARDESGGAIEAVTDEQILAAYRTVAREEAVFCEPASAASVAGLLAARDSGLVDAGSLAVCTLTGNGLKDPQHILAGRTETDTVAPDVDAVAAALALSGS